MNRRRLLLLLFIITINLKVPAYAQLLNQQYTWKSVQIRGGGFVDGVIYHPTAKGVLYCRTDMGGAYRWNDTLRLWEPMLDWVSYKDDNLMGVESIALDASNPALLYMACGTYTSSPGPNAILISSNRGRSFKRVDVPFRMGGNENGRGNGERMAVDPNNGNIIYMGTRLDGLWRSEDRAATWKRVKGITAPVIDTTVDMATGRYRRKPNGVIFVVFDPKTKVDNKSAIIYAGISQKGTENLFRSTDGGSNWQAVPGQPFDMMPTHAVLSADGILYITYGTSPGPDMMTDGAVYAYDTRQSRWKNITPMQPSPQNGMGFGYAAVAVDAQHPQSLIVSTFNRYGKAGGEEIFRSTDGGTSWKPIFTGGGGGRFDYSSAPYVVHTGIHWLFDLEIDPFNSDHAIFTTGYGLHETFNLTDADKNKPTLWYVMNKGIEETVALDLLSPPKGPALISAIGDYGGFVHHDLDEPAPEGNFINPHFSNTDGISCAAQNSDILVRVGTGSTQVGGGNIGYSLNGGKSWQVPGGKPQAGSRGGVISVSASGQAWVWVPQHSPAYVTFDNGTNWKPVKGLPDNTRIIADPLNPAKFYAMALFDGKLYTSLDSGNSFNARDLRLQNGLPASAANRGDIRGGQDRLYTAPGREGDLWLAAFDGLYHAANADKKFEEIKKVEEIHAFGFGKAAAPGDYPALYLAGTISGQDGIFRSDDEGKNWVRINDDQHRWGLILQITGDPKKYGRVYVGTHGRGIFYGDINGSKKQ